MLRSELSHVHRQSHQDKVHRRPIWRGQKAHKVSMPGVQIATNEFEEIDSVKVFRGKGLQIPKRHRFNVPETHIERDRSI